MMRCFILLIALFAPPVLFCQPFTAIPANLRSLYAFDLRKNFFKTESDYYRQSHLLTTNLTGIDSSFTGSITSLSQLDSLLSRYSKAEEAYRQIDLYLFLRYAVNMNDSAADRESDSLRAVIRTTRQTVKRAILKLPADLAKESTLPGCRWGYYIRSVLREKEHIISAGAEALLRPFQYLKDASFYNTAIGSVTFDSVETSSGKVNVFIQLSAWQSDTSAAVRREGQIRLFKGYNTKREAIGRGYIDMVKGLDAFSKAKNFTGLVDEKLLAYQISPAFTDSLFSRIITSARQADRSGETTPQTTAINLMFTITEATTILNKAFGRLGNAYATELSKLLNPLNGRMDIAGGGNRYPMRGTASVYPIYPSVFYAYNYEGYPIDLTILAHESGHAVQASLMKNNNVPLLYGAGPGYFTESFGKFNELVLFDYLLETEKDAAKKAFYRSQLQERIRVIYGSAEEAYIEYSLVKGILSGAAASPDDLDSLTLAAGSAFSPKSYREEPEKKNLWLVLETDYYDPLHNINDMVGAMLAVAYYRKYKENRAAFVPAYQKLLSEGYHDTPDALLKKLGIDMTDNRFVEETLAYINGLHFLSE